MAKTVTEVDVILKATWDESWESYRKRVYRQLYGNNNPKLECELLLKRIEVLRMLQELNE